MKWPDRRAGDLGRSARREHVVELAGLEADGVVGVDDALGSRVVPDVKPMIAGVGGIDGDGLATAGRRRGGRRTGWRPAGRSAAGVSPTTSHADAGRVRAGRVGRQVVGVAEAVGGHDHIGPVAPEDVVDLLGPVEVDDRHDHGPEVGGGPERDAGLDPVGELQDDDVAGPDAPRRAAIRPGTGPARSTSAKVPDHGRTFECTANGPSPIESRPSATIVPEASRPSHEPSAR